MISQNNNTCTCICICIVPKINPNVFKVSALCKHEAELKPSYFVI